MGKEKYKNKRGVLLLTNKLGKFERLNQEEWKILINGVVQGLAQVAVVEKRSSLMLQIQGENWTPLTVYMGSPMDGETALSFIWNSLRIAFECERHGLRIEQICWDPERVFVDAQGNLIMVYWPVTSLEEPQINALMFYYSFCGILYESGIDRQIADRYYSYFYQRSSFDYPSFYTMIQEILERWRNLQRRVRKEDERRRQMQPFGPNGPDRSRNVISGWLERPDTGEQIMLNRDKMVFGRDGTVCDVALNGYDGVSRQHGAIHLKYGQHYLSDMGSRNGTYLDGHRLTGQEKVPLNDGQTVRFGDATYIFHKMKQTATIHIHQMQR